MSKLHVAAFASALFVAAGIAPSFADGTAVNVAAVGATTIAGTATMATSGANVALDFGKPPSGEIPIIYNDHHVYANPSILRQNRTLSALIKNGVIMVPLRSMFEDMGATVSYDAGSKTVTANKPGASIQVTLGKAEAVINGESRPLDVPPMMYKGVILVPVRVISETLGAYVQWVGDRRITVVRYIPPTPVPTAPPTPVPTAPPTLAPTPTPTPKPIVHRGFIQAGAPWGRTYNEFSNGQSNTGVGQSYNAAGAYYAGDWAAKVNWRQDSYNSVVNGVVPPQGQICNPTQQTTVGALPVGSNATIFNTIDGGTCFTAPFKARQSDLEARAEYRILAKWLYVGLAYAQQANNYGYPTTTGWGGGLEALPELDRTFTWYGSAFDYPNQRGNYTVGDPASPNFNNVYRLQYNIITYDVGAMYTFWNPFYIMGGFNGDRYNNNSTTFLSGPCQGVVTPCPSTTPNTNNQTHSSWYLGLGLKF